MIVFAIVLALMMLWFVIVWKFWNWASKIEQAHKMRISELEADRCDYDCEDCMMNDPCDINCGHCPS